MAPEHSVEKVETDPATDHNWDRLRIQLIDAMETDTELRDTLAKMVTSASATQTTIGNSNKSGQIVSSPGSKINIS